MITLGSKVVHKRTKLAGDVRSRLEEADGSVRVGVVVTVKTESGRRASILATFDEAELAPASTPAKPGRKARVKPAGEEAAA